MHPPGGETHEPRVTRSNPGGPTEAQNLTCPSAGDVLRAASWGLCDAARDYDVGADKPRPLPPPLLAEANDSSEQDVCALAEVPLLEQTLGG